MKLVLVLVVFASAAAMENQHPNFGMHELDLHNPWCIPHCSYVCMATSGRVESCSKLVIQFCCNFTLHIILSSLHVNSWVLINNTFLLQMLPGNDTLKNLPTMDSCPSTMSSMDECFIKCGCQCIRCTACMAKSLAHVSIFKLTQPQ